MLVDAASAADAAAARAEESVVKIEGLDTNDAIAASKVKIKKKRGPKSGVEAKSRETAEGGPMEGAEAGEMGEVPAATVKPKKKRWGLAFCFFATFGRLGTIRGKSGEPC